MPPLEITLPRCKCNTSRLARSMSMSSLQGCLTRWQWLCCGALCRVLPMLRPGT
jgi:hypothetical protein